jgi:hypothetical protein
MAQLLVLVSNEAKTKLKRAARENGLSVSKLVENFSLSLRCREVNKRFIPNSKVKIEDSEVRQIRADRRAGMSYRALALKYGHGLRTVHRACRGEGYYRRVRQFVSKGQALKFSPDQVLKLREEAKQTSIFALSKKYNYPKTTLYKAIKGQGVYKNVV